MEHAYVALNVGGQTFYVRLGSLRSIPQTLLTDLVDASLPLDLAFGGRAISEEDKIDSANMAKTKHGGDFKADGSSSSYSAGGISTNRTAAASSHPYDRAKYVYLSCSNKFRPVTTTTVRSLAAADATLASPSATTQGHSALTTSSPPSSSSVPFSTRAPPQQPVDRQLSSSPSLFVPATCLTSPRHRPVGFAGRKPKHKVDGFTNKSFRPDEDYVQRSKFSNHKDVTDAGSIGDTETRGYGHSISADDPEGHPADGNSVNQPLKVDHTSLVRLPQATDADVYVDRNPILVPYILDLYRHGQLHLPPDVCSLTIRSELDFWKIPEELIGECCWREFQNGIDRMQVVRAISATLTDRYDNPEVRGQLSKAGRVWLTMERPDYSKRAKIWCGVYYLCILLSTVTFMMLSLAEFQHAKPEFSKRLAEYAKDNDTLHVVHYGTFYKPVEWLEVTEICLDIFFTLEFTVRLVTCPDKREFVRNKHNIIDMMILSTAWTRCIYDRIITWDHENFTEVRSFVMIVLNSMLGLRVLRMLHLAKIFRTLKVMYLSILASMQELALLVVVMAAGVLLFGSVLFIAEGFSTADSEPLQFASVPEAMWWAIITMTTVGYGDYYPTHAAGYVVGAICAVTGLLLVAMPIAIVASNFSLFYDNMSSRDQSLRRQAMFGHMIGIAMATTQDAVDNDRAVGGATQTAAGKDSTTKHSGTEFEIGNSSVKNTLASHGNAVGNQGDFGNATTKLKSDVEAHANGQLKSSLRESSHRKNTAESRKDKLQDIKHRSTTSIPRRDTKKETRGGKSTNADDEVKYHKSRHRNAEKDRPGSPVTVEYVGIRANGKAKDGGEDRSDAEEKNLRSSEMYNNVEYIKDKHRARHSSGQSTQSQLSPVG